MTAGVHRLSLMRQGDEVWVLELDDEALYDDSTSEYSPGYRLLCRCPTSGGIAQRIVRALEKAEQTDDDTRT